MGNRQRFFQKLNYRFDTLMAKSPLGLIKVIAVVSITVALLLTLVMVIGGSVEGDGFGSALWAILSTEINAWMPSSEDGDALYVIMMAAAAIVGLMITSVLIGIISGTIEEKLNGLRRGNSLVIESGHTIVLGFVHGEYTLINELIASVGDNKEIIVIAGDTDKDEADEAIRDNINCPKNVRLIYRTVDICDPVSMKCLSIETCRSVAVTPMDDVTTLRSLFALCRIIDDCGRKDINIAASLSDIDGSIPDSTALKRNITVIHTGDVLSRIIAHSCTQPGLSHAFAELLDFKGSELFDLDMPECTGMNFGDITENLRGGVPVGIISGGETVLCPTKDIVYAGGDHLIIFSADRSNVSLTSPAVPYADPGKVAVTSAQEPENLLVIGRNGDLPTILNELPEKPFSVVLADYGKNEYEDIKEGFTRGGISLEIYSGELSDDDNLAALCDKADNVVLLNGRDEDADAGDLKVMVMLTRLRDLRESRGLSFNVTAELQCEHNRRLVSEGELTDYVVAGDMAALTLAQLTRSPSLHNTFRTLLSNEGCELYLVPVSAFGLDGVTISLDIRRTLYGAGYVFLGYFNAKGIVFNPAFDAKLSLLPADQLIVIGENDI